MAFHASERACTEVLTTNRGQRQIAAHSDPSSEPPSFSSSSFPLPPPCLGDFLGGPHRGRPVHSGSSRASSRQRLYFAASVRAQPSSCQCLGLKRPEGQGAAIHYHDKVIEAG